MDWKTKKQHIIKELCSAAINEDSRNNPHNLNCVPVMLSAVARKAGMFSTDVTVEEVIKVITQQNGKLTQGHTGNQCLVDLTVARKLINRPVR